MSKPVHTSHGEHPVHPVKDHDHDHPGQGPKYCLSVEGQNHDWPSPTITTEEVIAVGGWDPSQGALLVDLKTNTERALQPGEVVELRPGQAFCKHVKFKRGFHGTRVEQELALLRTVFEHVDYLPDGRWVVIRGYALPEGWSRASTDLAFAVPMSLGTPPYAFLVPAGLRFKDEVPQNYAEPAGSRPGEGKAWGQFSWSPHGDWVPHPAEPHLGSNLLDWAVGFAQRFRSGR